MEKKIVQIILRGVPEDVHEMIVREKARIEIATGSQGSNPQAIYNLIRRATPKQ